MSRCISLNTNAKATPAATVGVSLANDTERGEPATTSAAGSSSATAALTENRPSMAFRRSTKTSGMRSNVLPSLAATTTAASSSVMSCPTASQRSGLSASGSFIVTSPIAWHSRATEYWARITDAPCDSSASALSPPRTVTVCVLSPTCAENPRPSGVDVILTPSYDVEPRVWNCFNGPSTNVSTTSRYLFIRSMEALVEWNLLRATLRSRTALSNRMSWVSSINIDEL